MILGAFCTCDCEIFLKLQPLVVKFFFNYNNKCHIDSKFFYQFPKLTKLILIYRNDNQKQLRNEGVIYSFKDPLFSKMSKLYALHYSQEIKRSSDSIYITLSCMELSDVINLATAIISRGKIPIEGLENAFSFAL